MAPSLSNKQASSIADVYATAHPGASKLTAKDIKDVFEALAWHMDDSIRSTGAFHIGNFLKISVKVVEAATYTPPNGKTVTKGARLRTSCALMSGMKDMFKGVEVTDELVERYNKQSKDKKPKAKKAAGAATSSDDTEETVDDSDSGSVSDAEAEAEAKKSGKVKLMGYWVNVAESEEAKKVAAANKLAKEAEDAKAKEAEDAAQEAEDAAQEAEAAKKLAKEAKKQAKKEAEAAKEAEVAMKLAKEAEDAQAAADAAQEAEAAKKLAKEAKKQAKKEAVNEPVEETGGCQKRDMCDLADEAVEDHDEAENYDGNATLFDELNNLRESWADGSDDDTAESEASIDCGM